MIFDPSGSMQYSVMTFLKKMKKYFLKALQTNKKQTGTNEPDVCHPMPEVDLFHYDVNQN